MSLNHPVVGGLATFLAGAAMAGVNYLISRAVLKSKPEMFAYTTVIRQCINVAYLAALYFLADLLPWGATELLLGGVIGITLPSFYFTHCLVKLNDGMKNSDSHGQGTPPREG